MAHARGPDTGGGYTEYVDGRPIFVTPEGRRYDLNNPEQLRAYYAEVYSRSPGVLRAYEDLKSNLAGMSRIVGQANQEAARLRQFANQIWGHNPQGAMELFRSAEFYESEASDYYDRINRLVEDYLSRQGIPQNAERELRAILAGTPRPGSVPTTTTTTSTSSYNIPGQTQTQTQFQPGALTQGELEQLRDAAIRLLTTGFSYGQPTYGGAGLWNFLNSMLATSLLAGGRPAASGNTSNLPYTSLRAVGAVDPLLYWHMINASRLGYRYPYYPVFNVWR